MIEKCIIVEGRSDKLKITPLLAEQVLILCTNGTIDEEALIDLLEPYEDIELFTFFDRDKSGDYLRKIMRRTYSEAVQLELPVPFNGVAEAPSSVVRDILQAAKFKVK
ncbi:hypothetical protein AAGS61_14510 [Lysinibacillus sp. KU-BSD001]|uniref:hypothetical protein n=1 Tax=Lysinibacillus sp. KU-BSD001 TaxID=3141328 RepID=UPI0036E5D8EF